MVSTNWAWLRRSPSSQAQANSLETGEQAAEVAEQLGLPVQRSIQRSPVEHFPQSPPRHSGPGTSTGDTFRYWDPTASRAWWVPRGGQGHLMSCSTDRSWSISAEMAAGGAYAFVAEWTQVLKCQRCSTRLREPHPDSPLVGLPVIELPGTEDGTAEEGVAEEPDAAADRMGRGEFFVEMNDMSHYSSDASSARLCLHIAPRVWVTAVEASAADGSWGPLALRPMDEEAVAAQEATGAPPTWIGDVLDCHGSQIILSIRRIDWRADPSAILLEKSDHSVSSRTWLEGEDEISLAGSPPLWCIRVEKPTGLPAFTRRSDRELVLYEMHIGSFTDEGTLKAATAKLQHVKDLGCTALSVMPLQQDARRLTSGSPNCWGYDILSLIAVDSSLGSVEDVLDFIKTAHKLGMAVIVDYVANHLMWGCADVIGPQYFLPDQDTPWGPRPDFSQAEVRRHALEAAEFWLLRLGADGLRVDSTKSIRKLPGGAPDPAGALFLSELSAFCRRHGRLAVAEDLEDGDGLMQCGGLGFHLQWDMSLFCWVYDALVNPMDEYRDFQPVCRGLLGLAPGRGHALRGRVIFLESHDTAASDRYGRVPAAVHNGKAFMAHGEGEWHADAEFGDAFQQAKDSLPYPDQEAVEANTFAARRTAIGLVLVMTAPGTPMLLQGQEVCDCLPFRWPQGPGLDWTRVDMTTGPTAEWQQMCRSLIAVRRGALPGGSPSSALGPFQGDGVHIYHTYGGVLAYLRWADPEDSRSSGGSAPRLGLVMVNCTHCQYDNYEVGIPPSKAWRVAVTTVGGGHLLNTKIEAIQGRPVHGFPCALGVGLQAYSAVVLVQDS